MISESQYYLKVGFSKDLANPWERFVYRSLEILPGFITWLTLFSIFFFSWYRPIWVAFFIIIFDVYWICKTVYFSFHLKSGYAKMQDSLKIDWLKKLEELPPEKDWQGIHHLVILPMLRENLQVAETTFETIINSHYPKDKIIVILALEERGGEEDQQTAKVIQEKFGGYFFKFLVTTHPVIVGELQGKGANETWAGRKAKEEIIDPLKIAHKDIIVSVFDIDTQIMPHYFSCLTHKYLTTPDPTHSSFQPVAVYNNNVWDAPAVSRVIATSGTFWQMMQQERADRLVTFSSHSMSFKALVEMDFWSTKNVSEDSRIFWQALLFYDGNYKAVPMYYPVSMDANLAPTLRQTMINVYKQQRRWAWGSENISYVLFGFIKNKKIPFGAKFIWSFHLMEGSWSWSTNALIVFLLGWLPLVLGGPQFNLTTLSYNLPRLTRDLMTVATFGAVMSAAYSLKLLPPRPAHFSRWRSWSMVLQWLLLPVTILTFGSLPAIDAQTRLMLGKYMGFWVTEKHRK